MLPGLDTDLDEDSWRKIGGLGDDDTDPTHTHPQATLRRLVDNHLRRRAVRDRRAGTGDARPPRRARACCPKRCGRPRRPISGPKFPPTSGWRSRETGCDGIAVVEATDEREEALAIAMALRETLNDPHRNAALVTPDRRARGAGRGRTRALGYRGRGFGRLRALRYAVGASGAARRGGCRRGPPASAGSGASRPSAGAARLAARDRGACRVRSRNRRAARPDAGRGARGHAARRWRTIAARRAVARRARDKRLTETDWDLADDLLRRLEAAFATFSPAFHGEGALDLIALTEHHRRTVEALLAPPPTMMPARSVIRPPRR